MLSAMQNHQGIEPQSAPELKGVIAGDTCEA